MLSGPHASPLDLRINNMIATSVQFRGHRCFKKEFVGFDEVKPVNIIIGRNNTGKSHLLDLVAALCGAKTDKETAEWVYRWRGVLDQPSLERVFAMRLSDELVGNGWDDHGKHFIGKEISWQSDDKMNIQNIEFGPDFAVESPYGNKSTNARLAYLGLVCEKASYELNKKKFRRLLADRDLWPEAPNTLALGGNGGGATNIIRRYIVTTDVRYPREVIQSDVLKSLNEIFGNDGEFTEIQIKEHDHDGSAHKGKWEVYLGEKKKGLVALSNSGSGLKTILLVLLNLLVVPHLEGAAKSEYVFAFEELENNLHPALLRRLLQFVEAYAIREKATVFLTTHSSTALDLFGGSPNCQILHVTHDKESARVDLVSAHFDKLGVVSELGARPSDLLQANGIIWVEGPSDCVYINRWLHLYSNGALQEGRDYQCAFYGGALLARTQFTSPEQAERELINLFRVNSNIIVVCDGDRAAKGARVKDRVRRIRAEVMSIPKSHIWVTEAREIENYIPGSVLSKVLNVASLPDPTQYECFFPRKASATKSYVEAKLKRSSLDKMDLAIQASTFTDKALMDTRFDWKPQMEKIIQVIQSWNH